MNSTTQNITKTPPFEVWLQKNLQPFAEIGKTCRTAIVSEQVIVFGDPFLGKMLTQDEHFSLFKNDEDDFFCVDTALLSQPVKTGELVILTPYKARDFNGLCSNGSDDPQMSGVGAFDGLRRNAKTNFPARWEGRNPLRSPLVVDRYHYINNLQLRNLIEAMELLPASMRRNGADVLVSNKARNLRFIDPVKPTDTQDRQQWPAIEVDISTAKFTGTLAIRCTPQANKYCIELLHKNSGHVQSLNAIQMDDINRKIEALIDDGAWKKVKVHIAAPKA